MRTFKKYILDLLLILSFLSLFYYLKIVNILSTEKYVFLFFIYLIITILVLVIKDAHPKKIRKIIGIILCIAMIIANGAGTYFLHSSNSFIDSVADQSGQQKVSISLYALKHSEIKNIDDLQNRSIGYLEASHTDSLTDSNIDTVFHQLKTKYAKDKPRKFSKSAYSSSIKLADDFLGQKVDCMLIDDAKLSAIENTEGHSNIRSRIRKIYTYSFYKKTVSDKSTSKKDPTKSPFTVLISGSDSRGSIDEISRSDVDMLVTVNPKTHMILMTSIPRDYYVTTACDSADGCGIGEKDKLTHTGIHGINTTEKTIESFMNVKIDYNVKVGFDTVTQLVDTLGGIDIYNPQAFTAMDGQKFAQGNLHLNGTQALAFARERYSFKEGDNARGENQMRILTGILTKITQSPSTLSHYGKIMQLLSDTFQTNMPSDKIKALVQYQLNNSPTWQIYTDRLSGEGGSAYCYELGDNASVVFPDEDSIKEAKQNIEAIQMGDTPPAASENTNE